MAIGSGTAETWVPQWLLDKLPPSSKNQLPAGEWIVDFRDPTVVSEIEKTIAAMGTKLDGNKRMSHMDIGGLGMWGEWHMYSMPFPMPNSSITRRIIDAHFSSFPQTALVVQTENADDLQYATGKGAGIRSDCFGDMSTGWNHMLDRYPQMISLAPDAWKTSPIAFESCWTIQHWVDNGWNLTYIFDKGIEWHTTFFNNKEDPIPAAAMSEVNRFLRKIGYRLVLKSAALNVNGDGTGTITTAWKNVGVAPLYMPTSIKFRLTKETQVLWAGQSTANLKAWLPSDSITATDAVTGIPVNTINATINQGASVFLELGIFDHIGTHVEIAIAPQSGFARNGHFYRVGLLVRGGSGGSEQTSSGNFIEFTLAMIFLAVLLAM